MLQRASCSGGGPRIPPVPAARARQGAWRVAPRDHGMEHQADVHPQLRLILPDAGPGCEKNGRRATWAVTTRSGRRQVPVAVLPTAKSLSASLKPQSDRLLQRCLRHRADMLASIMRQAIGSSSKPSLSATDLLKAACGATAASFTVQVEELVPLVDAQNQARVRDVASNFAVLGYALVGEDGELLRLDDVRALNARADVGMPQYANIGWNSFLPLHVPERAPQMRSEALLGEDRSFLEGMRLPNTGY